MSHDFTLLFFVYLRCLNGNSQLLWCDHLTLPHAEVCSGTYSINHVDTVVIYVTLSLILTKHHIQIPLTVI